MPGSIPLRNASAGHTGAWPVPGWSSAFEWQGWIPFSALPRTFNPPEGFVVSANNAVPPPSFPIFISADWDEGGDGYRATRIRELIQGTIGGARITPEFMGRVQSDTVSGFALDIGALIASLSDGNFSSAEGRALSLLLGGGGAVSAWSGDMRSGSQVATLWAQVFARISRLASAETGTHVWKDAMFTLNALSSDASPGGTDPACTALGHASCSQYLASVLDLVGSEFGVKINADGKAVGTGGSPGWGKGDLHSATFTHQVLGQSPLSCMADRSVGHGGDDYTVNVGSMDLVDILGNGAFAQTAGPSYREIIDLSAPDASLFMHGPGQSGNVVDIVDKTWWWYDSLVGPWADGNYMSVPTEEYGTVMSQTINP